MAFSPCKCAPELRRPTHWRWYDLFSLPIRWVVRPVRCSSCGKRYLAVWWKRRERVEQE